MGKISSTLTIKTRHAVGQLEQCHVPLRISLSARFMESDLWDLVLLLVFGTDCAAQNGILSQDESGNDYGTDTEDDEETLEGNPAFQESSLSKEAHLLSQVDTMIPFVI
ncbi:hypothetical protein Trydic_g17441 [Trypoxylus dichotomus]